MTFTLPVRFKRITAKTIPVYLALAALVYFARFDLRWFVPGVILVSLGEGIRIWAAGHLRKTKEVTTTGPYAYVKNPLYLGTFLIMVGFCFMATNFWLLGVGIVIFLLYYAPFKKNREGQRLKDKFGEAWENYDRAVPDYFPNLRPYSGRGESLWTRERFDENSEDGTFAAVALGVVLIVLRFWIELR